MNVVPFPKQKIYLTEEEIERFNKLKEKLANSITPGEATHYKNELDSLVARGINRK
ncbi:hypothetical protein [Peribacillus deserti]|uniref:hypothetical protein n=1 Tax=Peribacillus deserti TaxID=673318 RepID=UPI0015E12A8D|nr:hypothetical protein [Peribacillus deserti]